MCSRAARGCSFLRGVAASGLGGLMRVKGGAARASMPLRLTPAPSVHTRRRPAVPAVHGPLHRPQGPPAGGPCGRGCQARVGKAKGRLLYRAVLHGVRASTLQLPLLHRSHVLHCLFKHTTPHFITASCTGERWCWRLESCDGPRRRYRRRRPRRQPPLLSSRGSAHLARFGTPPCASGRRLPARRTTCFFSASLCCHAHAFIIDQHSTILL